ncbi:MAG TPA: carboxypeptidase-like regulatory domain-containing protein [Gemmatimonadales bacterium]|jgi:hypothetical protein|nr:carboxypeptidase-like regulatory domain-containing protein [Gemmatimonadales bacterium]
MTIRGLLPLVLSAALLAPLPRLAAQAISGRVVSAGPPEAPVRGALVLLRDSTRRTVTRDATDADGRFQVTAPAPGTYSLRVLRIGYAPYDLAPWVIGAQGDTFTIKLPAAGMLLAGITVTATDRCQQNPGTGSVAATLWSEAEKAVDLTVLTIEHRTYRFQTAGYVSTLDTALHETEREESQALGVSDWPFETAPADTLATYGYVRGTTYYGPDLGVLFSPSFLSLHCLRAERPGPGRDSALVGVAFEPVRDRTVSDIAGVLWIDRNTSELRDLEFHYTDLRLRARRAGGQIDFRRLPSGAWVIQRWWLRAPMALVKGTADTIGVGGYRETGANVTAILTANGRPLRQP